MRRSACLVVLLCAASTTARAEPDAKAVADARQVAGLFVQSCVRFAGDTNGLRDWASKTKFAALPPQGQQAFLNGLPGIAYDATNPQGKFVLVSEDDGECSTVAEHADPNALVTALEDFLKSQNVVFQMTGQRSDRLEAALQHREYSASQNGHPFAMLISTSAEGGEAMLSVTRP